MNSKPHRTNSNFHLQYFIAGSCHTPDGAYAILKEQSKDIAQKIEHSRAQALRREAKILDAQDILDNPNSTRSQKLRAEADIIEAKSSIPMWEMNHTAAEQELVFIESLLEQIEPNRRYSHLPFLEANEAMQHDEWLGEFKRRAENFLFSIGTIPHDHLEAMRNHPAFEKTLLPYIQHVTEVVRSGKGVDSIMIESTPVQLLLEKRWEIADGN